jgi:hypothetical protein
MIIITEILVSMMKITNMRTIIIIRAIIIAIDLRVVVIILLNTIMQKLETAHTRT